MRSTDDTSVALAVELDELEEGHVLMAPSREEDRVEALWAVSERAYGPRRRRKNCTLWIRHHERLAGVFRSRADHHAREQERYQGILAEESEDAE
jgi:hypothetical protein